MITIQNVKRNMLFGFTLCALLIITLTAMAQIGWPYPIDGYQTTGIRRLERLRLIVAGKLAGPMPAPGSRNPMSDTRLHLEGERGQMLDQLPASDSGLQAKIDALFPGRHESYAMMVLDITPGRPFRLAARQPERSFSPGSVGKLAIAAGLFSELKSLFPNAVEKRRQLLRDRLVVAGSWIQTDRHDVPIFDPDSKAFSSRPIHEGDVFSLYEWTDHMLSASANAAASTVWKELLLMRHFGSRYPPSIDEEKSFFTTTAKNVLRDMAFGTVNEPLRAIGIMPKDWQLGSFFTAAGKKIIPSGGKSQATARGLMQFLVAMERGRIVDQWSSLELKRLMYMSARRIRYASSPGLTEAAVYYKSGSLFRCKPEPGFHCQKYKGNVENVMNSVIIVEQPDGRVYLVTLMSDILRKNSAVEHQTIGTQIDRMLSR